MKTSKKTEKKANVVGPLLRKFRLDVGLTQKELAALCSQRGLELTRATLAKIESQVRFIKACELFIIAKILGVPVARFCPFKFGDCATSTRRKSA